MTYSGTDGTVTVLHVASRSLDAAAALRRHARCKVDAESRQEAGRLVNPFRRLLGKNRGAAAVLLPVANEIKVGQKIN